MYHCKLRVYLYLVETKKIETIHKMTFGAVDTILYSKLLLVIYYIQ